MTIGHIFNANASPTLHRDIGCASTLKGGLVLLFPSRKQLEKNCTFNNIPQRIVSSPQANHIPTAIVRRWRKRHQGTPTSVKIFALTISPFYQNSIRVLVYWNLSLFLCCFRTLNWIRIWQDSNERDEQSTWDNSRNNKTRMCSIKKFQESCSMLG